MTTATTEAPPRRRGYAVPPRQEAATAATEAPGAARADAGAPTGRHGHDSNSACMKCFTDYGYEPITEDMATATPHRSRAVVVSALDVVMEPATWLWAGRIPKGHITIIDGDPGVGKSTLLLDIAARATRGVPMPAASNAHEPVNILVMSTEDALATTIKPRLQAADADMARVSFFNAILDDQDHEVPLTIPDDIEALRGVIQDKDIELIVIDPLVAFFGKDTDSNNDKDVRRALRPLFSLLQDTGTTAICLRHLTKDRSRAAMYRGGGSIGITGQARSAFLAGYDPEDENEDENARRRVLAHIKSNLAPKQKALAYITVSATVWEGTTPIPTSKIEWLGEVTTTAEDVAAGPQPRRGPEAYARAEAESILRQLLEDGPIKQADAEKAANDHGIAKRTLRRAKETLGIRSKKEGADWYWYPPDSENNALAEVRAKNGTPEPDWWTGDTNLRADEPDKPHFTCRGMHWEWAEGRGWGCAACHPRAVA